MTMTLETNPQRFGPLSFDHMSSYQPNQPHFTNPWAPSSTAGVGHQSSSHSLYASSSQGGMSASPLSLDSLSKPPPPHQQHHASRSTGSMAPYGSIPVSAASTGSAHSMDHTQGLSSRQLDLPPPGQGLLSLGRLPPAVATTAAYGDASYTSTASPIHSTYASASSASYESLGRYAPAPLQPTFGPVAHSLGHDADHSSRRYSQTSMQSDDRSRFADALEASQGMLSMSQETPRNIYGPQSKARGSADSYGFPSTHSNSSSVSSASGFGYYAPSSVSDYSTAGSDIESVTGRTLPRPHSMIGPGQGAPPAPQSMMSQFSSKVASTTQKKHKCKVCDKRFTRPSSLQTHMYSHTGEKPFTCEVEGCGRQFSVVSNLRRHKKVHRGDARSEAGSEDHHSDD